MRSLINGAINDLDHLVGSSGIQSGKSTIAGQACELTKTILTSPDVGLSPAVGVGWDVASALKVTPEAPGVPTGVLGMMLTIEFASLYPSLTCGFRGWSIWHL